MLDLDDFGENNQSFNELNRVNWVGRILSGMKEGKSNKRVYVPSHFAISCIA
uniref:Uncharacterized protein n=1 Tax=Loa loa TaxID=7209 RepID=A0A1I7VH41_LOALO